MQERLPCRAVVRGQQTVQYDFSGGAPCVLRLQLAVRNCLPQAASVSVEAGPQHSASTDGESAMGFGITTKGLTPAAGAAQLPAVCGTRLVKAGPQHSASSDSVPSLSQCMRIYSKPL